MSGGHFEYVNYRLYDIVTEIERLIQTNNSTEKNEFGDPIGYYFPDDIIEKFKIAKEVVSNAEKMIRHIDYLVCSDYGEDSFRKAWNDDNLG